MKKTNTIFLNALPVILMIALIPLVENDYILAGIYALITAISFRIKKENKDIVVLVFGFVAMIVAESFFIATGVETFLRTSLFGTMPLWLPFLWAYSFVAIKRSVKILEQ